MIDSLIIGALTFVSMMIISLFGVPGFSNCALLVGIVVGITNMIPYFGPFLGGIPSILLLCIYSLNSALIFAILIIIIQQLDGNLIGPKILGNSTGSDLCGLSLPLHLVDGLPAYRECFLVFHA